MFLKNWFICILPLIIFLFTYFERGECDDRDFSHLVVIAFRNNSLSTCLGTLITKRHIITLASCTYDQEFSSFMIITGTQCISRSESPSIQEIMYFPEGQTNETMSDNELQKKRVAVIVLTNGITINQYQAPIPIVYRKPVEGEPIFITEVERGLPNVVEHVSNAMTHVGIKDDCYLLDADSEVVGHEKGPCIVSATTVRFYRGSPLITMAKELIGLVYYQRWSVALQMNRYLYVSLNSIKDYLEVVLKDTSEQLPITDGTTRGKFGTGSMERNLECFTIKLPMK